MKLEKAGKYTNKCIMFFSETLYFCENWSDLLHALNFEELR